MYKSLSIISELITLRKKEMPVLTKILGYTYSQLYSFEGALKFAYLKFYNKYIPDKSKELLNPIDFPNIHVIVLRN